MKLMGGGSMNKEVGDSLVKLGVPICIGYGRCVLDVFAMQLWIWIWFNSQHGDRSDHSDTEWVDDAAFLNRRTLIFCPGGVRLDWEYFEMTSQVNVEFDVDNRGLAEAVLAVGQQVIVIILNNW